MKTDLRFRQIMLMAGKLINDCRVLQTTKTKASRGVLAGIELSGDLNRIVNREKMEIAGLIPEMELLALYRLATRRSISHKFMREEKANRGPIIVSIDESGSMNGNRIIIAKSICLAMIWLAKHQKRWTSFYGFSTGSDFNNFLFDGKKLNQKNLIDFICHFFSGGTTANVPLELVPSDYQKNIEKYDLQTGSIDHIIITDCCMYIDQKMIDTYNKWSEENNVTTYTIVIGSREAGDIGKVTDKLFCVPNLDPDSLAVQEVLSI